MCGVRRIILGYCIHKIKATPLHPVLTHCWELFNYLCVHGLYLSLTPAVWLPCRLGLCWHRTRTSPLSCSTAAQRSRSRAWCGRFWNAMFLRPLLKRSSAWPSQLTTAMQSLIFPPLELRWSSLTKPSPTIFQLHLVFSGFALAMCRMALKNCCLPALCESNTLEFDQPVTITNLLNNEFAQHST